MTETLHLNQLASLPQSGEGAARPIALWVPSGAISCFEVAPLSAPRSKWDALLPWQLEDQLLGAPDKFQIAWHQEGDSPIAAFAVPVADLSQWLMMAEGQNCTPQLAVPDFFALPLNPRGWAAYVEGDQVIVRSGEEGGFGCDSAFFWQLLQQQLQQPDFGLWLWSPQLLQLPESLQGNAAIEFQQRSVQWETLDLPPQYNLLRGRFAAKKPLTQWREWRWTAALAATVLVLLCSWWAVAGYHYQQANAQLEQRVAEDFRALFNQPLTTAANAQDEGQRLLDQAAQQQRLLTESDFSLLKALDMVIARCDCQINSANLDAGSLTLGFAAGGDLEARFAPLKRLYQLRWLTPTTLVISPKVGLSE